MENKIEIYQTAENKTEIRVLFEDETVWLNRHQMASLFDRDIKTIGKHINNIFSEGELEKYSVVAKFATTAADGKTYQVDHYNLDVIISVGYRVKSQRGTRFRQWATQRLKDYLVQGYAINRKRLEQKQQEVRHLKDGIRILSRVIEQQPVESGKQLLQSFAKGLQLLDDYDHSSLDTIGRNTKQAVYPSYEEYISIIEHMNPDYESGVFARPKDESFHSSIQHMRQSIGGEELYQSLEEKAGNLLYLIVKNHSFVDGNKRIAAACFLYFLEKNEMLDPEGEKPISNEALASLTLFIASSKPDERETVVNLIISILNRSHSNA